MQLPHIHPTMNEGNQGIPVVSRSQTLVVWLRETSMQVGDPTTCACLPAFIRGEWMRCLVKMSKFINHTWLNRVGKMHKNLHIFETHTGEWPYECGDCGRTFRQSGHLQHHQRRVHSGEKPYTCDHCTHTFSDSWDLEPHHRSKHTHKCPYTCQHGGAKFAHPSNFRLQAYIFNWRPPQTPCWNSTQKVNNICQYHSVLNLCTTHALISDNCRSSSSWK